MLISVLLMSLQDKNIQSLDVLLAELMNWVIAPDDVYVVYSDRLNRRFVVNEFEIED